MGPRGAACLGAWDNPAVLDAVRACTVRRRYGIFIATVLSFARLIMSLRIAMFPLLRLDD